MNFNKPEQLAVITSLITAVCVFIVLLFFEGTNEGSVRWDAVLVIAASTFAVSFLVIRYAVGRFLYRRLKLIYKNIDETQSQAIGDSDRYSDLGEVQRDVSEWAERKKKEITALKVRERYRREFIGNVSHELKTPIFNIQGYILTLLDGALEDEEINREYLIRANKSVERMIRLVQDLELITKLEGGVLQMDMEEFDVCEIINEVVESLELKAKKRHVDIVVNSKDKPVIVVGDDERIKQVLTNLLVNAIKYSKDEGGLVTVSFYEMDKQYLIEVKDQGVGISQEDLPRLFERFYRVDKSRSRDLGGTGLGLAIVKHIVEAHGQNLNVKSTVGVGSTFSFTLKKG